MGWWEALSEEESKPQICEGTDPMRMCREMGILERSNRLCKGPEAEKTVTAQPRGLQVNHVLFGPPGQMRWPGHM